MPTLRPMPPKYGIGFVSDEPLSEDVVIGYRYEQVGTYHNYHVTSSRYHWPLQYETVQETKIIDGFSPNMNKELHIGHLRNLAIANSLSLIFEDAKFVSLIGCSLGVKLAAIQGFEKWTNFVNFKPKVYYDCALPQDVVETRSQDPEAMFPNMTTRVWDGPKGEVIVQRSDGRYLYAFHDLAFASYVGPTHYITGHEQCEHFASIGLSEKHYPMGLVLGDDGKKMKSRNGEAFSAKEAIEILQSNLNETPQPEKVAWNVLAWNCLQAKREKNLQFEPQKWTQPDSAGMYITYTYARILSAFGGAWDSNISSWGAMVGDSLLWRPDDPQENDVRLAGFAEQYHFYLQRAITEFDPSPLAQFAHDLARQLSRAYHSEPIKEGRQEFRMAVLWAAYRLRCCMKKLGLFILESV